MRQKKQRFGLTGGLETVKALFPSETELEVLEWEYLTIWNRLADCRCVLLHTQIQQLSCPPQIAVSDLVTYVITGGTLLCPLDAVLSECTELLQMLGVKPVFRAPFGRLRLAAAESYTGLESGLTALWSETVLVCQTPFSVLEPVLYCKYGAAQFPALWVQRWGKGRVVGSILPLREFLKAVSRLDVGLPEGW